MTRVTILGAGTLAPDALRHSAAHWVESAETRLLLDCGPGTLHGLARHGLPWKELTHVAVSHYHPDHVSDLVPLVYAFHYGQESTRSAPLTLVGPPGFSDFLTRLAGALGGRLLDTAFPMDVVELGPGESRALDPTTVLSAHPTPHTDESVCFRVQTRDGIVGYTGDTGPSETVGTFLAGSRVLIAECYRPDADPVEGHLTPSALAQLAAAVEPELVVVTHVAAPHTPEEMAVEVVRAGYDGEVRPGRDGLSLTLGASLAVDP